MFYKGAGFLCLLAAVVVVSASSTVSALLLIAGFSLLYIGSVASKDDTGAKKKMATSTPARSGSATGSGGGKQMDQGGLTSAEAWRSELPTDDIVQIMEESGYFKLPLPGWLKTTMRQALSSNRGVESSLVDIRSRGRQLSHQEKRDIGLRANTKVGEGYLEVLSEIGRKHHVKGALGQCARLASRRSAYNRAIIDAYKMDGAGGKVEFLAGPASRVCDSGCKFDGKVFGIGGAPKIPLADCDQRETCNCMLTPRVQI